MTPPFPERVHFIIRHASNLRSFQYIVIDQKPSSDFSVRLLRTCIAALEWSERKPTISILTRRPILGKPLGDLLTYINDKFTIMELDVQSEGVEDTSLLQFLSRFSELQYLGVWNLRSHNHNEHDMDQFLGHLPLRALTLHDSDHVGTFPHQLHSLDIQHHGTVHTLSIWAATCNLTHLSNLNMDCQDTEESQDEDTFVFKSSNLQTVAGTLTAKTEIILRNQIIKPIFANCRSLESVELHFNTSLSSESLITLLSKESLVHVDLSSGASPYTFQDFALLSRSLPNLERLRLPWPFTIGIPTNDEDETVMDWRCKRDSSEDVPERISFEQCTLLAAKFPKLGEIVFEIDTEPLGHMYRTWSGTHDSAMYLEPTKSDENNVHRAQGFKMSTFVDEQSPCVNICSVFVCSFNGNDDTLDGEVDSQMSMSLFLSLNQVRRHANHR